MGTIKDFILGRQIKIYDPKLGALTTKVRGNNLSKYYSWEAELQLKGQERPTYFILDGNRIEPDENQKKCVYAIIDSIDEIINQMDELIKIQPNLHQIYKGNWKKEFFLESVIPHITTDEKGFGTQFEISFRLISEYEDPKTGHSIGMIWDNGRLTDVEIDFKSL